MGTPPNLINPFFITNIKKTYTLNQENRICPQNPNIGHPCYYYDAPLIEHDAPIIWHGVLTHNTNLGTPRPHWMFF
jgi:hypothetical protein